MKYCEKCNKWIPGDSLKCPQCESSVTSDIQFKETEANKAEKEAQITRPSPSLGDPDDYIYVKQEKKYIYHDNSAFSHR